MPNAVFRILFGYTLAVVAATGCTLVMLALISGGWSLGWRDAIAGLLIIGVFAWGGLLFAIRGEFASWCRPWTYAGGGLLAMAIGVATLSGLGIVQGLAHGDAELDAKHALAFLRNVLELVALGVFPGIAGGLTYWLVAVPNDRKLAV